MATLPTSNLTTTAVANILGESGHSVSNLCTSDYINKWAKYKPVCYYNTNAGDRATIASAKYDNADGTGIYGSHANGDYGVAPAYDVNRDYDQTGNQVRNACNYDWDYQSPTGRGGMFPYRLGDFRGYDEGAEPFITFSTVEGATYNNFGEYWQVNRLSSSNLIFRFNYNAKDDYPNWVCADDLVSSDLDLSKTYIICAIYKDNSPSDTLEFLFSTIDQLGETGSESGWVVNPQTGFPNDLYLELDPNEFTENGTYYVYFAFNLRQDNGTNRIFNMPFPPATISGRFPIELRVTEIAEQVGLEIDESTIQVTPNYVNGVSAISNVRNLSDISVDNGGDYRILISGRMSFRFTFKNTSDTPYTYTRAYFRLRDASTQEYIQLQEIYNPNTGSIVNSFTVPGNGSITVWMPFEGNLLVPSSNTQTEFELQYSQSLTLWSDTLSVGPGNGFESIR